MNEKARILPPMDKHSICAPPDVPILQFYEGIFDTVFFSLNPFAQIFDSSSYTLENFWDEKFEESIKQRILKHTKSITWAEIIHKTDLKTFGEIDIALRTSIGGLNELSMNTDLEDALLAKIDQYQIMSPSEGSLPYSMINSILKAIQLLGYDWICVGSEYGDTMEMVWIEDILNDIRQIIFEPNLYTYDRKILITCHWDSFQTYICSNKENVQFIVEQAGLEGFYANKNTEVYWSLKENQFD